MTGEITSAAARVWAISSLREEVFSYLEKPSLAPSLTLKKRSFGEVVKALYAEMDYDRFSEVFGEAEKHVSMSGSL